MFDSVIKSNHILNNVRQMKSISPQNAVYFLHVYGTKKHCSFPFVAILVENQIS